MPTFRTVDHVIDVLLRPLAYAGLGAVVAGDALVPILPSEAGVIAGSAAAGSTAAIVVVLLVAWAGAVAGDVVAHVAGRRLATSRLARSRVARWADRRLPPGRAARGLGLPVVFGRFLPGGRTAAALAAGATAMPWRRYLPASAAGGLLWAAYVVAIGRVGGTIGGGLAGQVAIGLAVGLVLAVVAAGCRRIVQRARAGLWFAGVHVGA